MMTYLTQIANLKIVCDKYGQQKKQGNSLILG